MNKFELKGKVKSIEVIREGKVAVMHLEIESNGYVNVIPVTVFNKLSDVVRLYVRAGDEVTATGAIQCNYHSDSIDVVAFNVKKTEQMNTKKAKKVTKSDEKITEVDKKVTKTEKVVASGPVKKLDRFDGLIINVYNDLSSAAADMFVKKSDLKRAIQNGTVLAGYRWSY